MTDGAKMSKSVGNVKTVRDLSLEWDIGTLRTAMLMTHYSKPIDLNFKRLKEAETISRKNSEHAFFSDHEWSDRQMKAIANGYRTRL